jgi:hypothetical protein
VSKNGGRKLAGSHSKSAAATHAVIPIAEAYNRALEETAESPAGIVERRKAIAAKLSECDEMISEVLDNRRRVGEADPADRRERR